MLKGLLAQLELMEPTVLPEQLELMDHHQLPVLQVLMAQLELMALPE